MTRARVLGIVALLSTQASAKVVNVQPGPGSSAPHPAMAKCVQCEGGKYAITNCSETAQKTSPRAISHDRAPGLATMNGPGAVTKSDGEADKPVGAVSSSSTEASLTVLAREGSNETREAADC